MVYKAHLACFLFFVALIIDALSRAEYSFIVAVVMLLFFISSNDLSQNKKLYIYLIPFVVSISWAAIYGSYDKSISIVMKDLWYFIKPILFILLGFSLRKYIYIENFSRIIFFIAVIAAAVYSLPIILSGDFFHLTPDQLRDKYGQGSYIFIFGLIFCRYARFKHKYISAILCIFLLCTIVLSSSRIMLMFLAIFIVVSFFPRLPTFKFVQFSLVFFMVIAVIPNGHSRVDDGSRETFFDKIIFSLSEIRPQIYLSDMDIHERWRGYETYMALSQYRKGGFIEMSFGQGLGTVVPIDFAKRSRTGDQALFNLEWLHNGYMTILLKCGLFGVFSFFFAFYYYLNKVGCQNTDEIPVYRFSIVMVLIATFFLGGFFNKSDVFLIFVVIGFLYDSRSTEARLKSEEVTCGR